MIIVDLYKYYDAILAVKLAILEKMIPKEGENYARKM